MFILRVVTFVGVSLALVPARAEVPDLIGVAAPLSGPSAILGEQVVRGAREAAGGNAGIVPADTQCGMEGGVDAAQQFVEAGTAVVIGFLCTEALIAALPILSEAGIPVIVAGVRANRITDDKSRTGFLVWRIAPRSDAEARAIADVVTERWRNEPFGLIEDGSIANRGLVDAVRRLLADNSLEPATTDNFRPAEERQFGLARRLERTGVSRFFIAGDRPDIAVIARDTAELGLDLEVIGSESLIDETSLDQPLPEGITAVAPPFGYDVPAPDGEPRQVPGYQGLAFAATEIAISTIKTAAATDRPLGDILDTETFETALGPVTFDEQGDADAISYEALRWTGESFVTVSNGRTDQTAVAP